METDALSFLSTIIAGIITIIVLILFITMSIHVRKMARYLLRINNFMVAMAEKKELTIEKECPECKKVYYLPTIEKKSMNRCPYCGSNNI